MPRRKLRKLTEFAALPHVLDESMVREREGFAGCFDTARPLILEVGCGKGEHAIELAKRRPEHNIVGIDLKAARLHAAASLALQNRLNNVAFYQMEWRRIPSLGVRREAEEAWLLFPDPHPKQREAHRRLTTLENLGVFQRLLKPGAKIHLRSDSPLMMDFTARQVEALGGSIVAHDESLPPDLPDTDDRSIRTNYENRFREEGRDIGYLCFSLPEPAQNSMLTPA